MSNAVAVAPDELRVALGEYDIGWHDPDTSLDRAAGIVTEAAANGARLVVLPEMCTSGFTMDVDNFAEAPCGGHVTRLAGMAGSNNVWLIAGVPMHASDRSGPVARNGALVFAPTGVLSASYYKQRLFAFADEHRVYQAGHEPIVIDIDGVRVSPFICYDLRFPELFRRVATQVDLMVVIASWPAARRTHWDVLLRARAIENQCYVIGVNRTGQGGAVTYDGGSAAYDPWGVPLQHTFDVAIVSVSVGEVQRVRAAYPFLSDADCS